MSSRLIPVTDEQAFLRAAEYDEFTEDPTAFMINKWLPRFTKHIGHPEPGRYIFKDLTRKPGIVFDWEQKSKDFPNQIADTGLVKNVWENIDRLGYFFCWTNLTW